MGLDHERLDVYQAALEFVVFGNDVVEQLPGGAPTSPTNYSELQLQSP